MSGTLFVVATPIGNLEDITARALRVLREASIIAAEDTRRTAHLLARYGISTPTTSLHEHNEGMKMGSLLDRLQNGEQIAVVSDAGTPTIADPGRQLIAAALDAGIRVEPIPGPNAAVAALAVSGFESDAFLFLGFPPIKAKDRSSWFSRARSVGGTIIFYEAPHRIRRTLRDFQREVGGFEAIICREMTKKHEELVKGQITEDFIEAIEERGEFTVVVSVPLQLDAAGQQPVDDSILLAEFGEITESGEANRRAAVSQVARRHGMKPNVVYQIIERGKKSIE
jgi:16S rRNA (cytidine1402-2'-O)-methyltransferase